VSVIVSPRKRDRKIDKRLPQIRLPREMWARGITRVEETLAQQHASAQHEQSERAAQRLVGPTGPDLERELIVRQARIRFINGARALVTVASITETCPDLSFQRAAIVAPKTLFELRASDLLAFVFSSYLRVLMTRAAQAPAVVTG
jgi:hypothetical protein